MRIKKILTCCALLLSVHSFAQIPQWKITDFEKYISSRKGKVLVFNFWATFCKPCIAEIPSMIQAVDSLVSDKVELILVSVDVASNYPVRLNAFVQQRKWNTGIYWLNETDADYFCPKVDSSWGGSIPATLIINTSNGYRAFYEEEFTAEKLRKAITKAL